ncbi:hypothetical protein PIB30_085039 [Stylosanthes scabra]|uniref:Uncharacterized protein n=1 Tax=Stylosanthes scabra TaxID=79078 RepID=A0ABU6YQB4_9FABA|nr:hypothetical protein [Stylosanthes scabra]
MSSDHDLAIPENRIIKHRTELENREGRDTAGDDGAPGGVEDARQGEQWLRRRQLLNQASGGLKGRDGSVAVSAVR